MSNQQTDINFKCDSCQEEGTAFTSDIVYTQEGSERGMGGHVENWGTLEVDCNKCSQTIVIEHNFTEYPVGCFEDGEFKISNATLTKPVSFSYDFNEE